MLKKVMGLSPGKHFFCAVETNDSRRTEIRLTELQLEDYKNVTTSRNYPGFRF
jgi:hypothetical protein